MLKCCFQKSKNLRGHYEDLGRVNLKFRNLLKLKFSKTHSAIAKQTFELLLFSDCNKLQKLTL